MVLTSSSVFVCRTAAIIILGCVMIHDASVCLREEYDVFHFLLCTFKFLFRVEGSSIVSAYAQAEEAPFGYSIVLYTSSTEQGEPFVIRPRAESTTLLEDPDESVFADVPGAWVNNDILVHFIANMVD